jgi:NAD(P)-dependent dehydrogenase (short-subunit alcohol dehydrogenase family)
VISLDGKVAVVTGAAGGIGAATARLLSTAGAAVVISDINIDGAQAVAEDIRSQGGTAEAVRTDISSEAEVRALIEKVEQTFGRLDILDNNAGILGPALGADLGIISMDVEVWDRAYAVNCRGTMLVTKHALPLMIRGGGGSIINIASTGAAWGQPRSSAYGTTKAAIVALTKYIAVQHRKDGIRCNTISPGMIGTDAAKEIWKTSPLAAEANARMTRLGEPLDLANAVLFLASTLSEFITGQHLTVDGGLSAGSPLLIARTTTTQPAPNTNK